MPSKEKGSKGTLFSFAREMSIVPIRNGVCICIVKAV